MVTFDICKGNPGALSFIMSAYEMDLFKAERAFQKLQNAGITGDKMYMLWNDCCERDTERTVDMILDNSVEVLNYYINYENGRGLNYCPKSFPNA